jgi:O-Antigen ligase
MAIATPSAKSHERVTGRWIRDLQVKSPREWTIYYTKQIVGTPIPYLLLAYAAMAFFSRAGLEIAAWSAAILTIFYIIADQFNSNRQNQREFHFFRIGCDFFAIGFLLIGLGAVFLSESAADVLETLSGLRWVILLYAMTYCWELFPGLNRVFLFLVAAATIASGYGIWQHFTGVDLISGQELKPAPVPGALFFAPISFFSTAEHMGTLIGMALAFPAAAYLLDERRGQPPFRRYSAMGILLILILAVFWTYRPGMWLAAAAGLLINILIGTRHSLKLALTIIAFLTTVTLISYGSPSHFYSSVENAETVRAEHQRAQIATQVKLWEKSPWIGTGHAAVEAADYDPGTGNVYFQILAQTGLLGATLYLLFILGFLLATYRIFQEIPLSHYWHRVFVSGSLAAQLTFHVAGLYWSTESEAMALNLYVLIVAATSYVIQHYSLGIVTDDQAL